MPFLGLGLLVAGYAIAYYGVNVLVWGHTGDPHLTPAPLVYLFGFPVDPKGRPLSKTFKPPFELSGIYTNVPSYHLGGSIAGTADEGAQPNPISALQQGGAQQV